MAECYYSYSFDLADGLIWEEVMDKNSFSPMRAVGLEIPVEFDDFIDVWKSLCHPIFETEEDEKKLTRSYFREAYEQGKRKIAINLEHNPLKVTYATKYTCVNVKLFEDEKTKHAWALVHWENNPELEEAKKGKQ